ncbi:MauE/DoxX family redox-associated membrane protein [Angustibacter luteus]|uniref:MauE/DoxX family redox-associated membrane protein n=1 Tax=Angustibacter luteus TaxID=658456 RepID=A0ABW1JEY3_9ACTN
MGNIAVCAYLAAAVLLVLAGLPKLRDPLPLVRAVRSVGLPAGRTPVRAAAAAEVLGGVLALVRPGRLTAVLVAVAYLVFTGFVALALSRGGVLGSCGCFGRPDTPPTRAHLVVTGLLAASGVAVALDPPAGTWWAAATDDPALAVAVLGFAVLLTWLSYLVIAVLPTVTPSAVRSATAPQRG